MRRDLLALALLCACPKPPVVKGGPPAAGWSELKAQYGSLETIAGRGRSDADNEWQPAFEGGRAVDAELSRPHMAMADAAGNVYIADKEAQAVRKVAPDGAITTVAGTGRRGDAADAPAAATGGALNDPNGLYVLPDGRLFILDLNNAKIRKVTPEGVMSTLFAVPGGISLGRGLWIAEDESEAFVSSGTALKRWTPSEGVSDFAWGFGELGMVARERGGRLLVADRGYGMVFAAPGGPLDVGRDAVAGDGGSGRAIDGAKALRSPLRGVRAVWPHESGGMFLGTHEGCQVLFLDKDGFLHVFLDGARDEHGGDGQPWDSPGPKVSEVRSVTLTPQGDLLIVENDAGFVRRVKKKL
jgi:hypothetical protein